MSQVDKVPSAEETQTAEGTEDDVSDLGGNVEGKVIPLETILEGKLLEIGSETQTPLEVTPRAKFYFEDNASECDSTRRESHYFPEQDEDEDSASLLSLPAELPPPPDGGYGWVIVLVSFLANMTVDGIAYSFASFLDVFSDYFSEPKGTVAWVSSLLAGMYLSVGPIVSALSNYFGCRVVCIAGSIIGCIAYASTVFANSIEYLMITQGVIAGFGFGLMYLPAVVCVGYYFESKRALATGIAVCGSGVGTMIFPPVVNLLIQNFGWKITNLILAGIVFQGCIYGSLMRPLEVPKMKKKDLLKRVEEEKIIMESSVYLAGSQTDGPVGRRTRRSINSDPGVHSATNMSAYLTPTATATTLPTIEEGKDLTGGDQKRTNNPLGLIEDEEVLLKKMRKAPCIIDRNCSQPVMAGGKLIPKNGSVPNFQRKYSKIDIVSQMKVIPAMRKTSTVSLKTISTSHTNRISSGRESYASFVDAEDQTVRQRRPSKERNMMFRPMSRQDIFYTGSISNLQEFKSQTSMLSYRESVLNLQGTGASQLVIDAYDGKPVEEKGSWLPDSIKGILCQMLDFTLLKNPMFLVIGFANVVGMLGFYTPFVYLPAAAGEKGIDKESATFLISIIGITNTIGRVLSGLLADVPCISALWINNLCLFLSGLCVFLIPFAYSYASFVVLAVFFGFFVSPFIALTSIILVDLLGIQQLISAFGLLCIFRGVAGVLGPPTAAAYVSLTSIILVELLGLASLTNAFGLLILFRGTASMVGPPAAGSLYDATKSYDVSFYVAGVLLFITAAMHCLVPVLERCFPKYSSPVKYTTSEYYSDAPEKDEENEMSPDPGEGIILNIKPKETNDKDDNEDSVDMVEK